MIAQVWHDDFNLSEIDIAKAPSVITLSKQSFKQMVQP